MNNNQKEYIIKELKCKGFRITKQRKTLLDVILDNECRSCKEIYVEASRKDRKIGSATVYRMVNLLEDIGALDRKNLYKISYPENCGLEEACTVELKNGDLCHLSAKEWNRVLQVGLNSCGYPASSISSVTIKPCSCQISANQKREIWKNAI